MAVAVTGRPLNLRGSITMRVSYLSYLFLYLSSCASAQFSAFWWPRGPGCTASISMQDSNFILQGMIETDRKGTLMVKNQRCHVTSACIPIPARTQSHGPNPLKRTLRNVREHVDIPGAPHCFWVKQQCQQTHKVTKRGTCLACLEWVSKSWGFQSVVSLNYSFFFSKNYFSLGKLRHLVSKEVFGALCHHI